MHAINAELRPPLVTDVDRKWALDQCPAWASLNPPELDPTEGEIIDETDMERHERMRRAGPGVFCWTWFVDDEIAKFERYFRDERKTYGDWSRLFRLSWWPQADPRRKATKAQRKAIPSEPHPFVKRGDPRFAAALEVCTGAERRVCELVGVVQFRPDDPRAKVLKPVEMSALSKRIIGEGK